MVVAVAHLARASIEAEAEEAAVYTCDESRVRKSWSLFSAKEKATYVSAVKALSDAGHYSTFVGLHLMLGDFIHATAMFFPFNRLFVWEFENALRATAKEYACVTVPLWDWAADNQAALTSNALNSTDATTPWAETHAFWPTWAARATGARPRSPTPSRARATWTRSNSARGAGTCYVSRVSHGAASPETARECAAPASDGPLNAPFGLFADATFDDDFALKLVSSECAAEYAPLASRARDWSGVAARTPTRPAPTRRPRRGRVRGRARHDGGRPATWLTNETRYGTKPEDRDAAAHFCATYANYSSVGDLLGARRAGSTSGCGPAQASLGRSRGCAPRSAARWRRPRARRPHLLGRARVPRLRVGRVGARAQLPARRARDRGGRQRLALRRRAARARRPLDGSRLLGVRPRAHRGRGRDGLLGGQPYNDSLDDAIPFAMPRSRCA